MGVKRGDYSQAVSALKAAAYKGVRGKVDIFEFGNYVAAFDKAKTSKANTVVLKYWFPYKSTCIIINNT